MRGMPFPNYSTEKHFLELSCAFPQCNHFSLDIPYKTCGCSNCLLVTSYNQMEKRYPKEKSVEEKEESPELERPRVGGLGNSHAFKFLRIFWKKASKI